MPKQFQTWTHAELARDVNATQESDKDFIMMVDGQTGGGKSTFAIKQAKKTCPWFDIKRDVIYSREELIDAITNSKVGSTLVCDEAINMLFSRDFMKKEQKFVLRLLDMCRDRNLCLIMCVPNFWSIDKHVFQGRVKLRVHIARTGLAFLWKPSTNPFFKDCWCKVYNEKATYNWDRYPNATKTKGFIGYLNFTDMCDGDKELYLQVKKEKKEMIAKMEEEKDKKKLEENKKLYDKGMIHTLAIAKKFGMLTPGKLTLVADELGMTAGALGKRLSRYIADMDQEEDGPTGQ